MSWRSYSKRLLAMLLCVVMVVGIIPASVFAATEDVDYLFLATDRHANTSIIGNIINNMENTIGENELDYLGLGGDMVGSGNNHPSYNSSTVLGEVTSATSSLSAANVDIVAGIHDMNVKDDAGIVLPYQGGSAQIYEGDKFYVYGVEEYCISDDSDEENWSSEAQKFVTWANGADIDASKAIIVLSHYPLHVKRSDNDGAYYWHQALNDVATADDGSIARNVFFFHGHNHTVDGNNYVYNVGDTMSIQNGSSTTSDTIYYTYTTAGYLNQNSQATLMTITDSEITLTRYTTSGSGTAMTSVNRVVTTPAVTLSSIEVSGATGYSVGDELALTVTAVYSDGSTADVTADATLSGYDMSVGGVYTVTAAYEGQSATITITVNPMTVTCDATYVDDNGETQINGDTVTATGNNLTGITAQWKDVDLSATYGDASPAIYDIALEGYTEGETVEITMERIYTEADGLKLCYVNADGTTEEIIPTSVESVETDDYYSVIVTFTTTKVGTFAIGTPEVTVSADADLVDLTITAPEVSKYFVEETNSEGILPLDITGLVVVATYSDGTTTTQKEIEWNEFDATADAYSLTCDMTVLGYQDVLVSYTYTGTKEVTLTQTFQIWIGSKTFTSDDETVSITVSEPGTTKINVTDDITDAATAAVTYVVTNYTVYNITLESIDGNGLAGGTATVTLPIPEGVTNPKVYYVSDNGAVITDMKAVDNGDGTVSFQTNHFSTYVLGDGTTIETESGNAPVEGTEDVTTTTYDTETVTVYKLVTTPEVGKQYLIVNTNSGTGYGLDGNEGGYSVSVSTDVSGYYTTWNGTPDTSTALAAGTYATADNAYLWTVGGTAGAYTFSNGNTQLGIAYTPATQGSGCESGTEESYDLSFSTSHAWSYNSTLVNNTYNSYSLYCSSGTWSVETTGSNVYFYEPVTVTKVTTNTTTTPGTEAGEYSTVGTDITDAVAISGVTVDLSSVLYWTPEGGTASEVTDHGLTPTYEVVTTKGNPNVITSIDGNVATLSGTAGTAVVKVTYTDGNLVAWDELIVTANNVPDADYTIDLTDGEPDFNSITEPITIKNIQSGMTSSVWAIVKAGEMDLGDLGDGLTWTTSNSAIATIDSKTGTVTFTGEEGTVDITVYYTCPGGRVIQDTVTYSVTKGSYTVPEDGTDDFPEYPDPGAIRFDKHATAVGSFSETGMVQVELSMTGVPYGTDTAIDVVVMLDMTGSMSDDGMEAAEEATKAFVAKIVKNKDGSYNKNRVAVYAFNSGSSSPYELVSLKSISSDSELETANTAIDTASNKQASGGTPFDEATKQCYDVLQAAKTNLPEGETTYTRKQFCVFMSDGGPTTYYGSDEKTYYGGNNNSGDVLLTSCMTGYNSSDSAKWKFTLPTEYYTDAMKADGVTVYTVGLLLQNKPNNPAPYSSMTSSTYDSTTDSLTTIGSHYYFTSSILKQMASDTNKYIDIFNVDNASKATAAFESIAQSILDAATDVKVTDKIADDYTMVFEAPNTTVAGALPSGQEFYIEVKDYVLNPVYGSDGTTIVDYTRGSAASLMKLYLGKSGSTYYAASDANGTAYESPAFNQTAIGTMFYWTTTANTASGISVTVNGTTYYFVESGISNAEEDFDSTVWYNMASGAYASGNIVTKDIVDDSTGEVKGTNSTCEDLIIATPYFVYNAKTKMLVWTAEKLSTSELALSYFLYLDQSGGYSGAKDETDPGTYETNEFAYLSYTNFQGTECQQEFPVPQMTWNGAQVSYVFYLVNENGQPVNRAGKVVPFSEAVYVTDVFTHSIVWNDEEQVASLEAEYLAQDLVPQVYALYDSGATYNIHVFEDEQEQNLNNHFVIGSGKTTYTTYVFNAKSDATKYKTPGTYAASTTYKCKEYVEGGQYTDDEGTYNIVTKTDANVVATGFDFSNTTVAFAVVWKPALVEDTVVVDYGLDVVINVTTNDALAAGVVGVRDTAPSGVTINSGAYDRVEADTKTSVDVYIDANHDADGLKELKIGTATVENLTSVRFCLNKTNGMQFSDPASFYYESDVNYYVNDELQTDSMYSKVTVIPATTVYYEDSFVTLTTETKGESGWSTDAASGWTTVYNDGQTSGITGATQAQDRPGASRISADLDADNNYGYDSAYENMSQYSLGSAAKVNVKSGYRARAAFEFYGTGFDVISLTSNQTGTIVVSAYAWDSAANAYATTPTKSFTVDTYYGYTQNADGEWVTSVNDPNALYQVPVMKMEGLGYNKYKVEIVAAYASLFDHDQYADSSYDFHLDAIRIYDPTGVVSGSTANEVVSNAYKADGEGWPSYTELRNNVIEASNYTVTENADGSVTVTGSNLSGAIFIDSNDQNTSIADYVSYGPNNELYLASGQAIAFNVTTNDYVADVQLGIKVGNGNTVTYTINGDEYTTNSATDLYYSILSYAKAGTVTIKNVGGGILSLTNIKVTYTQDPSTIPAATSLLWMDGESAGYALMSLRAPVVEEEVPEATEPEATQPETTEPEITQPEETEPEATEPEVTEPGATEEPTEAPEEGPSTDNSQIIKDKITAAVSKVVNTFKSWFGSWFSR